MNTRSTTSMRPGRLRIAALVATVAVAGSLLAAVNSPAAQAADALPLPDGLTEATAAASCFEIKQNVPSSPDGVYWLNTPALGAPDRFYCDQTTDGGGWVLIGRGREDWAQSSEGQGTRANVRDNVTGQAAFAPRQLDRDTIDALLNDTAVSSLTDGVRLRRATNTAGTSFQEVRFTYASPRTDWAWLFTADQRIGTWRVDNRTGSGGTTRSFGADNGLQRVQYNPTSSSNGWSNGFGYGGLVAGSTDAGSFVYKGASGYARPFTQVYLRPKLTSSIFSAIADAGTPATTQRSIASSFALPTVWGVNGLGAAGTGIQNTEVSAFTESNGVVYVGGNFRNVQKSSSGASQVGQSYLAAFDVRTGELISSFRPTFNNQVKTLATLPDGRIAAGGNFSTVNGNAANGLVVLNGDGTTASGFTGRLVNKLTSSGGQAIVRSLDVQDGFLYVGGSFTHATGGSSNGEVYSRNAVRLSTTNGTPDNSWRMEFDGTVISLDASSRGDKVFFAGYFGTNKGQTAARAAAATTDSSATVIPWTVAFSAGTTRSGYQQTVKEVGDRVWLGGSEHMFFSYDRNSMQQLSTNITIQGGDFQAIGVDGDNIYAGCHCSLANYEGAKTWPNVGNDWTRASKIDQTGAWSASTAAYQAEFSPFFGTREGAGTWALFTDSTGVTWMGGDFEQARRSSTQTQWAGGFARFPRVDSTAPTTPSSLAVTTTAAGDALNWGGSTDSAGSVTYQVLRNDRVVATTTTTSITLPVAPAGTKYFVRAADSSGNLSASTVAIMAGGSTTPVDPQPTDDSVIVAAGSVWDYYYGTTAPAATWTSVDFAGGWATGNAPLGYGHANLGTTLTAPAPKPLTSYYRKTVQVGDPSKLSSVTLTTRADDGIVVYVNGAEVGRSNMPGGTVTGSTYASSAVSATNAVNNPVTFTVPASAFAAGSNVISAEVHANYRTTPSVSFEMTALATARPTTPVDPEPQPEPQPGLPSGTGLIADGAVWSYYHETAAPGSDWKAATFDATAWKSGNAPLGWGSALATQIPVPGTARPLATYYRSSFDLGEGQVPSTGLTLTTRADDGIVVYVNGVEVGRSNLPAGNVTHDATWALSAPNTAFAAANPVVFTVPASALTVGTNVVSVQVQSNYRSTPSSSFDLRAVVS